MFTYRFPFRTLQSDEERRFRMECDLPDDFKSIKPMIINDLSRSIEVVLFFNVLYKVNGLWNMEYFLVTYALERLIAEQINLLHICNIKSK